MIQRFRIPSRCLSSFRKRYNFSTVPRVSPKIWTKKEDNKFSFSTPPHMVMPDYLKMILTSKVYDVAEETPLELATNLSSRMGNDIFLKREDLQPVFSFKLRGAYNRMTNLSSDEKRQGILACSAGNHAQGVALSARKLGIKSTIIMPVATPSIKVNNVRALGSEVISFGNDFDSAKQECERLARIDGRVIIHPYDDPFVIAGQGTIGMEILRQYPSTRPKLNAIFCCVGGGGLIAGIGSYVKAVDPTIKIIGVETQDANAMSLSLEKGDRIKLNEVGLFADGAAVRLCGEETFRVCRGVVDEMVQVSNDEICAAIKDTFEDTRSILEPAGALSVAGCKNWLQDNCIKDGSYACITSGANMNFNRLRFVAERAELGEKNEVLLSVGMKEKPGNFMKMYSVIYPRNVTEFSYRYQDDECAFVYCSFEVTDRSEVEEVMERLRDLDMQVMDISENELAKNHLRYLGGGQAKIPDERLYRFQFPERPGALLTFLKSLERSCGFWNVTCFHYRNFGSDFGKVLAGIQVPDDEEKKFCKVLKSLKYNYVSEQNNPVYDMYLK